MSGVADLSDEELLQLATGPEDNLQKQRKRAGRTRPDPAASDLGGISDSELMAIVNGGGDVPRATVTPRQPAYQPTDYRAEANKLPPTSEADLEKEADRTANPFTRFMHQALPDSRTGPGGTPRYDDPVAHDPTAQMVLTGALGAGAGALAAPLGSIASGAANGLTQGVTGGAPPSGILAATIMGALTPGHPERPAHAPLNQREMDAVALKQAPPEPAGIPEGEHGNVELAARADQAIRDALEGRTAANKASIDEADRDLFREAPAPQHTFGAQQRLQEVRDQTMGASGPTLPTSDRILQRYQRNLETPEGEPVATLPQLRNLQKGLTNEADFGKEAADPLAQAALKQGAGVLSDRVRAADPRLAPGNIGGALDRYGANKEAIGRADELLGPESGSVPKLARTGAADANSGPGAVQSDREVAQLQGEEPAGNDLIDMIRARNTKERRKIRWSLPLYMSPENVAGSAARNVARNVDNIRFKLNPPQIDAAGNVAGRAASNIDTAAIPLELQLILMQHEQEKRNAGQ